ncbi:MAG: cupredoxin domain-containing protein [Chloroflexi bacterium]|nr:cupredoxin domain-containing protein [Chloroflexota bacterium]
MVDIVVIGAVAAVAGTALSAYMIGRRRKRPSIVPVGTDGFQEATIRVNGRYWPQVVTVRSDKPVRLRFLREESTPCSERVIFEGLGIERRLPDHQETRIELPPSRPGSYMFTCQMGVYQGWLVVVPAR